MPEFMPKTYSIQCKDTACSCEFEFQPTSIPVSFAIVTAGDEITVEISPNPTLHQHTLTLEFRDARNGDFLKAIAHPIVALPKAQNKEIYYLTCPCEGHTFPYNLSINVSS